MKKLFTIFTVIVLTIVLTSCGDNNQENSVSYEDTSEITVVLDIDFPDDCGVDDIEDLTLTVPEDSSVLDVLNTWAGDKNTVTLDPSSENPYVTGINGISASSSAGWIYEVNDEMIMESADAHNVENGDKISWEYENWSE